MLIETRLRKHVKQWDGADISRCVVPSLMLEAAEEINRLLLENKELAKLARVVQSRRARLRKRLGVPPKGGASQRTVGAREP